MQTHLHADLITEDVIVDLVGIAWQTMTGIEPFPVPPTPVEGPVICASIAIGGPWQGTMVLRSDRTAAEVFTGSVLQLLPDQITDADLLDVLGELANIVGGNLKGVVSGDETGWTLSLPVVSLGDQAIPGSQSIVAVGFECAGAVMTCEVLQHSSMS